MKSARHAAFVLLFVTAAMEWRPFALAATADSRGPDRSRMECTDGGKSLRRRLAEFIRSELVWQRDSGAADLREENIFVQACIGQDDSVTPFVIRKMEYDLLRMNTRFLVGISGKPGFPSVVVTVHGERARSIPSALLAAKPFAGIIAKSERGAEETVSHPTVKPPLLIRAGRAARFLVEGRNFRAEIAVIPLQSGADGQKVRVRDPETKQIMAGTVVGQNRLAAVY